MLDPLSLKEPNRRGGEDLSQVTPLTSCIRLCVSHNVSLRMCLLHLRSLVMMPRSLTTVARPLFLLDSYRKAFLGVAWASSLSLTLRCHDLSQNGWKCEKLPYDLSNPLMDSTTAANLRRHLSRKPMLPFAMSGRLARVGMGEFT